MTEGRSPLCPPSHLEKDNELRVRCLNLSTHHSWQSPGEEGVEAGHSDQDSGGAGGEGRGGRQGGLQGGRHGEPAVL